jgi:hypothetical protein
MDKAGNPSSKPFPWAVDVTAPTVTFGSPSPAANANGWNNSDVSISFTIEDTLAGVDLGSSTSSPLVLSGEGAAVMGSVTATDKAGNGASIVSPAVKIDKAGPTMSITTPASGATFNIGQNVAASYSCTDGLSGVDTCVGPVASGSSIDTASPGAKTFTVNATDRAGNPASRTVNYSVIAFTFAGFFAPVDNRPVLNMANAGQAIPVKWQLTLNGVPVSDPSSFVSLTSYNVNCGTLDGNPASAVEEYATGSSGLQYLGSGNWQFNWKTPKTYANTCRAMVLTLSYGSTHIADFKFK